MRVAGFINNSLANGKGMRFVVFFQGCKHECPGCHNDHSWPLDGGFEITIDEILEKIKKEIPIITGVTISGGEPFLQPDDLYDLITSINQDLPELSVAVYTGFKRGTLINSKDVLIRESAEMIDVLIDGKFDKTKTEGALRYVGSTNQRIFCQPGFEW